MRSIGMLVILGVVVLGLTGCGAGLETRSFQTRVIPTAGPDEVFSAAQVLMRREFGHLKLEENSRRFVTQPVEYQTSSDSGTARDYYGGRSTMRRIAYFSVSGRDGGSVVRLRIDLERKDTERQEAFQPQVNRVSDTPGHTPIQHDAATTTRQNTVWTFVKRDRRLERSLLFELQEQFAPEPEGTPAEPPLAEQARENQ